MANTESSGAAAVYVTAPSDTVASKLARGLVESKLAACVNTIQGASLYPSAQRVLMAVRLTNMGRLTIKLRMQASSRCTCSRAELKRRQSSCS